MLIEEKEGFKARTAGRDFSAKLFSADNCKKAVLVLSGRMEIEDISRASAVLQPKIDWLFISKHVVDSAVFKGSTATQVRKGIYPELLISVWQEVNSRWLSLSVLQSKHQAIPEKPSKPTPTKYAVRSKDQKRLR